jgi:hypothetical protein
MHVLSPGIDLPLVRFVELDLPLQLHLQCSLNWPSHNAHARINALTQLHLN